MQFQHGDLSHFFIVVMNRHPVIGGVRRSMTTVVPVRFRGEIAPELDHMLRPGALILLKGKLRMSRGTTDKTITRLLVQAMAMKMLRPMKPWTAAEFEAYYVRQDALRAKREAKTKASPRDTAITQQADELRKRSLGQEEDR